MSDRNRTPKRTKTSTIDCSGEPAIVEARIDLARREEADDREPRGRARTDGDIDAAVAQHGAHAVRCHPTTRLAAYGIPASFRSALEARVCASSSEISPMIGSPSAGYP